MKKSILFLCLLFANSIAAQNDEVGRYWVLLKDKGKTVSTFSADSFFHPAALKRRLKNGLSPYDFTDLPLESVYLNAVSHNSQQIIGHSRWFNAVFVLATSKEARLLENLPFVIDVKLVKTAKHTKSSLASYTTFTDTAKSLAKLTKEELAYLKYQTQRFQADSFKARNLSGKGVRIAVFDAGFPAVKQHEAFKHLDISITKDFHSGESNVFRFNGHGTNSLSCIGGQIDSENRIGMAPGATYLLARTENAKSEVNNEQEYWIMAAEWADMHGADIISSSLGYTQSHYFQEDMDGQTAPISKAAAMAAQKGILVFNAAGNEGSLNWQTIGAPADAVGVFAIGATDPKTDLADTYSSSGPSADGRLKPELSAPGTCIVANGQRGIFSQNICTNCYLLTQGTSFATPLTAGFAACALEAFPELSTAEIREKLLRSGHLYPYYDYANGYGIPQAGRLFAENTSAVPPTFDVLQQGDSLCILLHLKFILPKGTSKRGKNFYVSFFSATGKLVHYSVLKTSSQRKLIFRKHNEEGTQTSNDEQPSIPQTASYAVFHFEGYTYREDLK